MKKLVSIIMAIAAAFALTACGGGENTVTVGTAAQMAKDAAQTARGEEAAQTEGRYIKAQSEMNKLASDTVRNGKFYSKENCAVKPEGFSATSAAKTFPGKAFDFYRESCEKYVSAAVNQRKLEHSQAVAKQKAHDQKVAAAKLKACDKLASRTQRDACVAQAKRHV